MSSVQDGGRAMYFRHSRTGEIDGAFWVTGKSERDIDLIERGMVRNIHPDWFACDTDTAEPEERATVFAMLTTRKDQPHG